MSPKEPPNNLLETSRRLAYPLKARQRLRRVVHGQAFVFGGGRSANR